MPTLKLFRMEEPKQAEVILASIDCKKEDVEKVVSIFELFDKSVKDIKIVHVGKKGIK